MLSKNDPRKKKGKGILRYFFKSENEADSAKDDVQAMEPDRSPPPPAEDVPAGPAAGFPAGSLLAQAWEKWRGDSQPLVLSLLGNGTGCSLQMEPAVLASEADRLSAQLEKDAEHYLRTWEKRQAETQRQEEAESSEEAAPREESEPEEAGICRIYISDDGMAAWMFLFPPFPPQEKVEREEITRSMEDGGVTTGIDAAAVDYLCLEQPYFELVPFACGTPCVEGTDGSVKELYPRQLSNEVKINDNGTADYHTRNFMQPIKKGDVICEVIPPQEGVAGVRVDGRALPPRPVKAVKAVIGANTALTEDGRQVIAKIDGHLEFQSAFLVRSSLEIGGDVDYSTGDIDYQGDVHIRGSVRAGFSVRATGAVVVDGMVEAARIEAGGDVIVASGILGDNRALIKSGSNVRAKYLENCAVYAGKSVYTDCAIASQIGSDDSIVVTTGRGTVIGGTITAGKAIRTHIVGSNSGRKTCLVLGILSYTERVRQDSETALQDIEKERQELDKQIQNLALRSGADTSKAQIAKANLRKSVLAIKEEKLVKRMQKLEGLTADISSCRFECSLVYPITQLTILDYSYYFEEAKNSCIATFDMQNREIKFH